MSDPKRQFERIVDELGAADDALADALDARAAAVEELAKLRAEEPEAYFTAPGDSDVIGRVAERLKKFPRASVRGVMTEVLSACSQMSTPITVVYVGQEGGFGHLAARKHFGTSLDLRAAETAEDVLSLVERGQASYGILPFETSYDGAVTATLNLLARSDMKITAEIPVRRTFHLLSKNATGISTIYASSSAITACESFLRQRFPDAMVIDTRNGLMAAEHAKKQAHSAALGTATVAELSGLPIIERSIEDVHDLDTRYVAVGSDFPPRTGQDRTALAVALHDETGVLVECLKPFAERKINLYRLETRPARGWEWRYLILFEVDGHITDRPVMAAVEELRKSSRYVKVLGSYPRLAEV